MNWTKEQQDAIYKKGSNILVAAAAGSGKTAVLVERIIQKIINEGVDIDKLLVVTFTNAAASEMRERVLEAIYKKIDEEPDNENLQKQLVLLGKSNICTIHSFCLDVIKNNFFEKDLSANFRIGSEEEIKLLKQEVLEDVFEKYYEDEDENFAKLVDTYTGYRGDEPLKEVVLKTYNFMQSAPFPNEWLIEKVRMFESTEEVKNFSESKWGEILLNNLKDETIDSINSLKAIEEKLVKYPELDKFLTTIESDIDKLKTLYEKLESSWDDAYDFLQIFKFATWPSDKKIALDVKEEAHASRDVIKKKIMEALKTTLVYDSASAYNDIYEMHEILSILRDVIITFDKEFKEKKREKNIIDFNDIEHYALEILVRKNENGEYEPTEVAKKYQEKFEEIAIDEYQDSNEVQEFILSKVSRGNNLFMVGDVKQSIYKFRQACPELFMEKYDTYSLDGGNENGLKIQLFKNFRSKENVLDITNLVFKNIMSKKLGSIDYNEAEYLNLGAEYEEIEDGLGIAELNIINLKEDEDGPWKTKEDEESDNEEDLRQLEKEEIEAKFVANKIEEIINSKVKVKDKKLGYRCVTYKDIVILLRSTAQKAPIYEKELLNRNIPVFSDSSNEYLDTIEIQTIVSVLKILDNPIDDISLVSVMRSEIGTFTDNEILEIRLINTSVSVYDCLKEATEKLENTKLKEKLKIFLETIAKWREEIDYLSLAELIWKIYVDTGFLNYVGLMPNGSLRQANLRALYERAKEYEKTSFKGLFNFIKFIEKLHNGSSDMSSAKVIGENEDVVRIMSIHKSKGLEFPIVFLSSTAKKVNLQDITSNLLLHQELGIGPQYINYDKMIEYSTSAKDAMKIVIRDESISEEMRVLYVALTRAKEKLIITGTSNDLEKDIDKKKELLKIYDKDDKKINPMLLKKFNSYLDWLELVYLNSDMNNIITLNEINKNEIIQKEEIQETKIREFNFEEETDFSKLDAEFNWKYDNELLSKLPVKSTVSKIKEIQNEDIDFESLNRDNKEIGIANIVPDFLNEDEKITGSKKGTLMHSFLQRLDFKNDYTLDELESLRSNLVQKSIISEKEAGYINLNKVLDFTKSDLYKVLKECDKTEKEKAFCIKIKANTLFEEAKDETILVQGIIDLYGITKNGDIILVDYKTDYAENENELVLKYKKQLMLYKQALEDAFSKNVSNVYIYSTYLGKSIKIEV